MHLTAAAPPRRLHHVGITVNDLRRSIRFWSELTGGDPSEIKRVAAPFLATLVGYPDVVLEIATVAVSETLMIELLQYVTEPAEPYPPGTEHPGNVHICFEVDDMQASWQHAVDCGAVPVSSRPVVVTDGPQRGAQFAYLRTVDGASIELRAVPDGRNAGESSTAATAT
jgi:catechol 2,3-dioxygenase-like lactoylglutathione lyase family enzyme